ncbi:uncharacterized protein LOC129613296 [Condylostylus longicornis]|uniref:uncharacterized protein LOC129613296 n=1 Tax=Condylostylus longicornis TaxID=2530218 RepID=UPI00244E5726|nr:uncharacterized protein LOC129613296 [Condylostylus longicornis]
MDIADSPDQSKRKKFFELSTKNRTETENQQQVLKCKSDYLKDFIAAASAGYLHGGSAVGLYSGGHGLGHGGYSSLGGHGYGLGSYSHGLGHGLGYSSYGHGYHGGYGGHGLGYGGYGHGGYGHGGYGRVVRVGYGGHGHGGYGGYGHGGWW